MQNKKILCIDADHDILNLLTFNLEASGYAVATATDGTDALTTDASLILLDPLSSVNAGWNLLKSIRSIPVIVLTEDGTEDSIVQAFEMGCVDYLIKPFSVRELIARVKAVFRRVDDYPTEELIKVGPITIDAENYEAYRNDVKLPLTLKEYELLKILAQVPGKVLTRDYLLDRIWGYEFFGETRTVDVHIRHIRMKLGDDANMIETVRGVGYRMTAIA